MKSLSFGSLIAAFLTVGTAVGLPTISAKGNKFFDSNGNQFFIKGVAYQLTPDDPLANGDQCALDAQLMQTLGANTIRVYHVDATADHSSCMSTFDNAGIYLFVDLDTFDTQINPDNPTWNQTQLSRFSAVMDEFQQYNNTAGFFVGNEVMTTGNNSVAAPFVKAAGRDMKAYRASKGYREIPIGYSAADIPDLRPMLQNYMACSANVSENLDFYSLNVYEWCGDSSYQQSGYADLTANATGYDIPLFISETGCNNPEPRSFQDQAAIFGDDMNQVWSGAIVYEWIEEANNYGLISYGPSVNPTASGAPPDGFTRSGTPTPISPDFSNLQNQWKTLSPSGVNINDAVTTLTPPPCPAYTSGYWDVNGGVALPSLGQTFDAQVQSSITAGGPTSGASGASGSSATPTSKGMAPMPTAQKLLVGAAGVVGAVMLL